MVRVRPAIESDYSSMAKLIREFYNEHNFKLLELQLDADFSIRLAEELSRKHVMIVLEADNKVVGGLGGAITPFLLNANVKLFQEIFFYIKDGFRQHSKLLIAELKKISKLLKLHRIIMTHPNDKNLEKMERFYNIAGFKKLEVHFIGKVD